VAPPAQHPSPLEQLYTLARAARLRGLTFSEFWAEARRPDGHRLVRVSDPDPPLGAIRWPTDAKDRVTWLGAIDGTCEGWCRAYEGEEPLTRELAVLRIGPFLEVPEPLDEDDTSDIEALMAVA